MKIVRILSLLVLTLLLAACGPVRCDERSGDECLRVLFVGNSLTYVNDLPSTFSNLALSGDHKVEVGMVAEGGATFHDHALSTTLPNTLSSSHWDYVVLQEQSEFPAFEYSRVNDMFPAARTLVKQVRAINAQPLFFVTWARSGGSPENGIPDYESMQYEIDQGYLRIGQELHVPVVKVGTVWFRALKMYPDLELWQADGNHPAEQGTYLAACVFYVALFHESPVGLSYHANLPSGIASQIQEVANTLIANP